MAGQVGSPNAWFKVDAARDSKLGCTGGSLTIRGASRRVAQEPHWSHLVLGTVMSRRLLMALTKRVRPLPVQQLVKLVDAWRRCDFDRGGCNPPSRSRKSSSCCQVVHTVLRCVATVLRAVAVRRAEGGTVKSYADCRCEAATATGLRGLEAFP